LAILVIAIVAVGSVSAADDVITDIDEPVDDIVIDDVPTEQVDEQEEETITSHDVNNTFTNGEINDAISAASEDNDNHVVNFKNGTYYNAQFTLKSNVILDGHGSTLIGDGTHDIFTGNYIENFTIKNFFINVNNNTKGHGIYGHHMYNSVITNNTIYNCSDAINIYQIHENLTITDNTIHDFTGDGISLVNFYDYSNDDTGFANFVGSTVTGNIITGGEYGMFFGGNFKGDISNNVITGSTYGMEFKGKRTATNGKLYATFDNNTITGVECGISMLCPNVVFLNITNCNIKLRNDLIWDYEVITTDSNFNKTGYIGVYNSNFEGIISQAFVTAVGTHYGNNTGFP
jgi:hypothetical protein